MAEISDQSRIDFEAWASTKGMAMHLDRAESGLYVSRVTQNYMDCWMASQAKKADELEALREFKRHMVEMREADGFKSWAEVLVKVDQLKAEVEALRSALSNLLSLYEEDEGCRSLPQYIAGVATMSKETGQ